MDCAPMEFVLKMLCKALQKYKFNLNDQGDGNALKSMGARFTSHVFPGEHLVVSMWKDGSKIQFSAKTEERGLDVIVGVIELFENAKL